jgi:hypothetical protein
MHIEAFYLQVAVGSNTERLPDVSSGMSAPPDGRKYAILGEDNIREDMRSKVK